MKNKSGSIMLLITALIWGTAFVAQSAGMDYVEPFTYNGVRTLIGCFALLPVIALFDRLNGRNKNLTVSQRRESDALALKGGVCCGLMLFCGSSFQQCGISMTTAGKAGFITALYIVIVPLMGVFIKKKIPKKTWACVLIAVCGFYLLCVKEDFTVSTGDLLVLCSAFFFALHIMVIDKFTALNADCIRMSCVQFFTAGSLSFIPALLFETITMEGIWAGRYTMLYTGIMSCGVAYTLQILGQKRTDPTAATLILSLESVFAALSGWLILHDVFTAKEMLGCALVFAAVVFSQVDLPFRKAKN